MTGLEIVQRLREQLGTLVASPDAPRLDVEWLQQRCDDTLRYSGERRAQSFRQLQKDVRDFASEFPDVLPSALVQAVLDDVKL
jgi:hypothetical protein